MCSEDYLVCTAVGRHSYGSLECLGVASPLISSVVIGSKASLTSHLNLGILYIFLYNYVTGTGHIIMLRDSKYALKFERSF